MENSKRAARIVAFYLPQFHPNPENDEWWGKGFTEWRNVVQASPLFRGHYQPHLTGELGYYDLRIPEVQVAQAELAHDFGLSGFCYYHYWFNGKRLLERPFDLMLESGRPEFPFCLCWANESWTRAWDGRSGEVLKEQTYSDEDTTRHMEWLAGVFEDSRYIRIGVKPLFLIYRASRLPDPRQMVERMRNTAKRLGIGDVHFARVESFADEHSDPGDLGFDSAVEFQPDWTELPPLVRRSKVWRWAARMRVVSSAFQRQRVYDYREMVEYALKKSKPPYLRFPCVMPSWDSTARRKDGIVVFKGATPPLYQRWLESAINYAQAFPQEERIVFVNAWNEWGEGSHLEPDEKFGRGYLEATLRALSSN